MILPTIIPAAAFQARIIEATEDLQRAMFVYLIASSGADTSTLTPILSPTLFVPREGDPPPVPGTLP